MIAKTENTLTIDANIFNYLINYITHQAIPQELGITHMREFCDILDCSEIAVNDFIRTEFNSCVSSDVSKQWLKERQKKGTAIEVPLLRLPRENRHCLRDSYGFNIHDNDMKYLETCYNTIRKHLVTQNMQHFRLPGRNRRRVSMDRYLRRELDLIISTIDETHVIVQVVQPTFEQIATTDDQE